MLHTNFILYFVYIRIDAKSEKVKKCVFLLAANQWERDYYNLRYIREICLSGRPLYSLSLAAGMYLKTTSSPWNIISAVISTLIAALVHIVNPKFKRREGVLCEQGKYNISSFSSIVADFVYRVLTVYNPRSQNQNKILYISPRNQ